MPRKELIKRARARADAEHLHTWVVEPNRVWLVKSRKVTPGAFHIVKLVDGMLNCDCAGDEYRGPGVCTHSQAVAKRIQRDRFRGPRPDYRAKPKPGEPVQLELWN